MAAVDELRDTIATAAERVGPAVVGLGRGWGRGSGVVIAEGQVLTNATCEAASSRYRRNLPFIQEFEFVPSRGSFYGKLDELEAIFYVGEELVDVLLEIDRRARGLGSFLSELAGTDETLVRLSITHKDLENEDSLLKRLEETISRYS